MAFVCKQGALGVAMFWLTASLVILALDRVSIEAEDRALSTHMAVAKLDLDVCLVVQILRHPSCIFHCNDRVFEEACPLRCAVRKRAACLHDIAQLLTLSKRHLELRMDTSAFVRGQSALNIAVSGHRLAVIHRHGQGYSAVGRNREVGPEVPIPCSTLLRRTLHRHLLVLHVAGPGEITVREGSACWLTVARNLALIQTDAMTRTGTVALVCDQAAPGIEASVGLRGFGGQVLVLRLGVLRSQLPPTLQKQVLS
mmetsp:Transcript_145087/g.361907  ORF Transcript_145087/g.361907 Transcript_145087/m.361907 type:complete len:255 (+) Transcript_145087:708-1472(+)